ncbi:MAG: hypothetical protein EOM26_04525 [Alphaproteobacteria bacterium]|nr:hypothetical protein [Alphaproteobacteria bacterium]
MALWMLLVIALPRWGLVPGYLSSLSLEAHSAEVTTMFEVYAFFMVLFPAFYTALSVFLWFKARWLAGKMVCDAPSEQGTAPVSFEDLAVIASAFAGMLILLAAINPAVNHLPGMKFPIDWGDVSRLVWVGAHLVLGCLLLFRPRGLAKMLSWLRKAD